MPRAERERQMLDVATRVFAANGYERTSMDEIAAAVGVTKPMIYAYFGSKEGLLTAAVRRAKDDLLARVDGAVSAQPAPEQALWAGFLAFFGFVEENRDPWRVLFREIAAGSPVAEEVVRGRHELARLVTRVLADEAEARGLEPVLLGEADAMAHALVGAVESLANWWLDHEEHRAETMALRAMNFAWMGLCNLAHGHLWMQPGPDLRLV